jgi:hypothetical protein
MCETFESAHKPSIMRIARSFALGVETGRRTAVMMLGEPNQHAVKN